MVYRGTFLLVDFRSLQIEESENTRRGEAYPTSNQQVQTSSKKSISPRLHRAEATASTLQLKEEITWKHPL